jgi:hypothetical protein
MIILTILDCFEKSVQSKRTKSDLLCIDRTLDHFGFVGMSGPTTTTTTMGVLLERSEVDKSLKALEMVIAVFYDYYQLSASIAATSRKLARALKDTAVIKATSQYPGIIITIIPPHPQHMLTPCSELSFSRGPYFRRCGRGRPQVLKDRRERVRGVDERVEEMGQEAQGPPRAGCVLGSSDTCIIVEQKEDKSLDEYTMAANAKVKAAGPSPFRLSRSTRIHLQSAGIAYEKKAKRKDKDATEEHTRYTTLLSTLGSEMSSAKQSVPGMC